MLLPDLYEENEFKIVLGILKYLQSDKPNNVIRNNSSLQMEYGKGNYSSSEEMVSDRNITPEHWS